MHSRGGGVAGWLTRIAQLHTTLTIWGESIRLSPPGIGFLGPPLPPPIPTIHEKGLSSMRHKSLLVLVASWLLLLPVLAGPLAHPAHAQEGDLETLCEAVALFPDTLLSNVLSASTYPGTLPGSRPSFTHPGTSTRPGRPSYTRPGVGTGTLPALRPGYTRPAPECALAASPQGAPASRVPWELPGEWPGPCHRLDQEGPSEVPAREAR